MSLSPTQDLLERIDRLHVILTSELPTLSSTIPHHPSSILSRNPINYTDLSPPINLPINTFHSQTKSDSILIDELQQYIHKLERERDILLRSYTIILQLLKHHDVDEKMTTSFDYDYSQL